MAEDLHPGDLVIWYKPTEGGCFVISRRGPSARREPNQRNCGEDQNNAIVRKHRILSARRDRDEPTCQCTTPMQAAESDGNWVFSQMTPPGARKRGRVRKRAAIASTAVTFLSRAAVEDDVAGRLGLRRRTAAVERCRGIGKAAMIHNDYCPRIEVDAETYEVRADGQVLTCEPARELPLTQRYFLF
jgi:hypothetical protein